MASREDLGSWLEGGPRGSGGGSGLLGRRVLALCVDWLASLLVAAALFPVQDSGAFVLRAGQLETLAVFAVENLLLVGGIGTTLGHRLLGVRVVLDGADGPVPPGLLRAAVRTVLLCLVVPAVVWDGTGRGLHDRAAGSRVVRLRPAPRPTP
ncbi:RDD family protein [Cellulomonas endophytica]|uniref:RDD family protein n=1 Tax=Cellulomonas endophytica TaxID=2494735 RepID=UPI0010128AE2|nr:RDD family protein [Cellulomonas endophytica]